MDLSLPSVTSDSVLMPESEVGPLTSEAGEEAWDLVRNPSQAVRLQVRALGFLIRTWRQCCRLHMALRSVSLASSPHRHELRFKGL